MPAATFDDAVCLRRWEFSETSQTALLFTRSAGLVRGLAKGSLRPRSPYSGGIEPLQFARVGLIIKPTTELAVITEWDLLDPMSHLRRDLTAHRLGTYMGELLGGSMTDRDPHPELFDAAVAALRELSRPERRRLAVLDLQWAVLSETGYRPRLDQDALTHQPLPPAAVYHFLPNLGGVTAQSDLPAGVAGWAVRPGTLAVIQRLAAAASREDTDNRSLQGAIRLLNAYLTEVAGKPFVTADALD